MITADDHLRLMAALRRDWEDEVGSERFRAICSGKERGHRIADYAEEQTVRFIRADGFRVAFEHGGRHSPRARSMGDIWLESGSPPIFNPINIKAGIAGAGGQPNMVSLEKLTRAVIKRTIDSYWLLLIRVSAEGRQFAAGLTLINIFDYLDFMTFDSGPGQVMLRSDLFYAYVQDGGSPRTLPIDETLERLIEIRRDGDARLLENRRKRFQRLEQAASDFDPRAPLDQGGIDLRAATQVPASLSGHE